MLHSATHVKGAENGFHPIKFTDPTGTKTPNPSVQMADPGSLTFDNCFICSAIDCDPGTVRSLLHQIKSRIHPLFLSVPCAENASLLLQQARISSLSWVTTRIVAPIP